MPQFQFMSIETMLYKTGALLLIVVNNAVLWFQQNMHIYYTVVYDAGTFESQFVVKSNGIDIVR